MKKLLFILLACFISVSIVPMGNAGTPEECEGLRGPEFGLCVAYCQGEECDINPDTAECEDLRTNNERINGSRYFPCDQLIACALCGDPDPCNQQGTLGVCEEILAFECDAIDGALNVGEYPCSAVTIPADVAPGCSEIPPQFGLIPNCQYTGPSWVCSLFIGGVPLTDDGGPPSPPGCNPPFRPETCTNLNTKCPAPPTCLTECISDEDCYNDSPGNPDFICVDGTCADARTECPE